MTTPPTGSSGDGWSAPESGSPGWGPAPGAADATQAGDRSPASAPAASGEAHGWDGLGGAGPQAYGSVLTRRGIVALKPLGFGDFFDGAFRAIRHNPRAMIGLSALVLGVTNVLLALPVAGLFSTTAFADPSAELTDDQAVAVGGSLLALVPVGFLQTVAMIVLTGMLILSVTQSVVDRRLGVGQLWRRARGRVWPLIGWSLLASVAGSLLVALALTPVVVLAVLEELAGALVAGGVLGVGLVVLLAWLYVRLVYVPVLIVVERLGIVASVRRSFVLTRGSFWRTLGILLLTGILASLVSQVLATPFAVVGSLGLVLLESNPLLGGAVYAAAVAVGGTVGAVLSVPFLAAVVALLYVDRRIRLEGLDLALARTLEDEQA